MITCRVTPFAVRLFQILHLVNAPLFLGFKKQIQRWFLVKKHQYKKHLARWTGNEKLQLNLVIHPEPLSSLQSQLQQTQELPSLSNGWNTNGNDGNALQSLPPCPRNSSRRHQSRCTGWARTLQTETRNQQCNPTMKESYMSLAAACKSQNDQRRADLTHLIWSNQWCLNYPANNHWTLPSRWSNPKKWWKFATEKNKKKRVQLKHPKISEDHRKMWSRPVWSSK